MIAAIIQARMGSTRLPNKTLEDLHGKTLLDRVIDRAAAIPGVDSVVVATTIEPADDVIEKRCSERNVTVWRGSVDDVLNRFVEAARFVGADVIVRVTADDPFKDPWVAGDVLREFLTHRSEVDYVSNTLEPTWPEGLDIEVFSREALEGAAAEATLRSDHEHVTPFIYNNPQRFRIRQVRHTVDLSSLRWTLDYAEDLAFARAVYTRLDRGDIFSMHDILALLEREPTLGEINKGFTRNAGYAKSLAEDREATP